MPKTIKRKQLSILLTGGADFFYIKCVIQVNVKIHVQRQTYIHVAYTAVKKKTHPVH